jgi:predicted RNA-binding protein
VFFDEVSAMPDEMQTALKSMITGDGMAMRSLYTDLEEVESDMMGTAVFCATKLEYLQPDLRTRCFVWELENKGGGEYEDEIEDFCKKLWRRALAGAIKLYQQAAKLPPPPKNLLPEIRFRRWLSWAYRYAQILGVADKFVAYVRKSKIAAHKGEKFEFLIDALSNPNFDPNKEYTIGELIELADPAGTNLRGIGQSLNRESVRDAIITLALSMGYHLRIEKTRLKGETKAKLRFFFTPLQTGDNSRLRAILKNRGIEPDFDDDDTPPTPPPSSCPTPPPTTPTKNPEPIPSPNPTLSAPSSPTPDAPTDSQVIEFLENTMAEHDQKNCTTEQKLLYLYRFKERFWGELAKNGRWKVIDYIHKKISELETALHTETKKQT